MYLEPWHADVFDFLELKKNTGKEEQRARDLFFALWIPDLFMKRVESNQVNAGGNAGRRTSHFIINSSEANELSVLPDIFNCKVKSNIVFLCLIAGLVSNVPQRVSWVRGLLGREV